MKHGIKKRKTAADNTRNKSSTTPREIEKEKDIYSEFNHNRTQKFSEIGIVFVNFLFINKFVKFVLGVVVSMFVIAPKIFVLISSNSG